MNEQTAQGKRSVWVFLLGPLIAFLLWWLNPVAFFSNACRSPFASDHDRAVALDDYGDKVQAAALYSAHLRRHPDDTGTLLLRGRAYLELGDPDAAVLDLSEVLRQRPNELDAYRWRGDARMLKHDYDAAIADYTRAMDQPGGAPPESFLLYQRGLAALGAGRYDLALTDFNRVIAAEANDVASARGRDCAARQSNDGECASLPFDRHPESTRMLKAGLRRLSDCNPRRRGFL